jgi:hypothetical protein
MSTNTFSFFKPHLSTTKKSLNSVIDRYHNCAQICVNQINPDGLKLMAQEKNSQQFAETHSILINKEENHRINLPRNYNLNSTAQLMCLATSKGWVEFIQSS